VAALAEGLSLDDEDLLEMALDDRARGVRRSAADLLACLPQSALARRMAERLRSIVVVEQGWFRARKFRLRLPEACDDAMQRDGVEPKPRGSRGEKAWWLLQMVAAAPLTFWTEALEMTPAAVVKLAGALEWRGVLMEGWSQAAARQAGAAGVPEWAEALLRALLARPEAVSLGALLLALPRERREAFVLDHLDGDKPLDEGEPAEQLIADLWEPWSETLTGTIVSAIERHLRTRPGHSQGTVLRLLGQAGLCAAPAPALAYAERLTNAADRPQPTHWPAAVKRCLAVIRFRAEMLRELDQGMAG
jgi:hypothetical protein